MTNTLVFETDTLNMVCCKDGFWLYDETRGMNLAMKQKSEREAFIEALEYYQERLKEVEGMYKTLDQKVQTFVSQFNEDSGHD